MSTPHGVPSLAAATYQQLHAISTTAAHLLHATWLCILAQPAVVAQPSQSLHPSCPHACVCCIEAASNPLHAALLPHWRHNTTLMPRPMRTGDRSGLHAPIYAAPLCFTILLAPRLAVTPNPSLQPPRRQRSGCWPHHRPHVMVKLVIKKWIARPALCAPMACQFCPWCQPPSTQVP